MPAPRDVPALSALASPSGTGAPSESSWVVQPVASENARYSPFPVRMSSKYSKVWVVKTFRSSPYWETERSRVLANAPVP
ncbi:hypothetical protein ACFFQW_11120 [Umezawaea endophytica]|uniref:Uncharacterized protein n=1 Tax=Umezawaea endophytica TaxID=1654476 RepID=A0A9X3AFB9_9PSEU|nr:hypothetical protein [Umezawaea endophytica]MCS7478051.1 hypothetical protein [Umezawaea endophytica]